MTTRKILVVSVAALGHQLLVKNARTTLDDLTFRPLEPVFPALTCTAQASFRTAQPPAHHGVIANGVFDRTLNRPFFWEQSSRLVKGPRIWQNFRNSGKRVGLLFWQQSLGESADLLLSPAPIHKHSGGMIQDCYAQPPDLYHHLTAAVGRRFNLMHYWGPLASAKAGRWIADATASLLADSALCPDLLFTYLPTLDYDLQRFGPDHPRARRALDDVLDQLSLLLTAVRKHDRDLLIFGDYAIAPVSEPVFPNRALSHVGLLTTRAIRNRLYPDFHRSRAFAMTDHEIAHVYVPDPADLPAVRTLLQTLPGVERVLDHAELSHPRSGELILLAREGAHFAYPWWTAPKTAPDYAAHVDIHNKPGYDPAELFFGRFPWLTCQDASRIKGSHGRTGPGRLAAWTSTFDLGSPVSLIDLADALRRHLETTA